MPRYIDADALISKIAFHRDSLKPYNVVAVSAFDAVIDFIKRRPTVSPDEVRGVAKVKYEHGDYSCSACGHPARRLSFARKKYCDECGAKLLWEVTSDA